MAKPVTLLLLRFVPRAGPKYSNKPVPGRLAIFKKECVYGQWESQIYPDFYRGIDHVFIPSKYRAFKVLRIGKAHHNGWASLGYFGA